MASSKHPTSSHVVKSLTTAIDDAVQLLKDFSQTGELVSIDPHNPGSLLEQCLALCRQQESMGQEPIRTLHHFACTGGTLLSKCIAAMPNTQVLSEVDPLSTLMDSADGPRFAPTDMITLMRQSTKGASSSLVIELFLNNLELIYKDSVKRGQRLILRDHAHSHFCTGQRIRTELDFRSIVVSRFPVLSVVTVRHPLDSFLSLKANGWMHFEPATFDEYCKRYVAFMQAHECLPIIQYEEFVRDPHSIMEKICAYLDIPFSPQFIDLFSVFKLTGDSGRGGNVIQSHPRRAIEGELAEEANRSSCYQDLKQILGYEN